MTSPHWFTRPTAAAAGTFNLVFELLDYPVAMGGAEDVLALGEVSIERADLLDRVAKTAGIFSLAGLAAGDVLALPGSPEHTRAVLALAAWRIGAAVDAAGTESAPALVVRSAADASAASTAHPTLVEGTRLRSGDEEWDLHSLVRDPRIESAEAIGIPADARVVTGSSATVLDVARGSVPEGLGWVAALRA